MSMSDPIHGTRHATAAIGESIRDATGSTREAITEAVEHGREHAGHFYNRAGEIAREIGHRGMEQYQTFRGHVRRNALTSTLVAFAAGFVIARFLFRR
jgi:hypothetical protein